MVIWSPDADSGRGEHLRYLYFPYSGELAAGFMGGNRDEGEESNGNR